MDIGHVLTDHELGLPEEMGSCFKRTNLNILCHFIEQSLSPHFKDIKSLHEPWLLCSGMGGEVGSVSLRVLLFLYRWEPFFWSAKFRVFVPLPAVGICKFITYLNIGI